MAKGKYQEWLEPEGLLKLEGWARDGLTDEQIAEREHTSQQIPVKLSNLIEDVQKKGLDSKNLLDMQEKLGL